MNIETDITYHFEVKEETCLDYKFTSSILEWITGYLSELTDSNNKRIFSKVNCGYNEDTLRSFGNKPVVDVLLKETGYDSDFQSNLPNTEHTVLLCYLKGSNNHTYMKACELHDFLLQELIENESCRKLEDIVLDTLISKSTIEQAPFGKKWGVIVGFELTHKLY